MPGEEKPTSAEPRDSRPDQFTMKQNYPNPFNPTTRIEYHLEEPSEVTLEVFNMQGQLVRTLVDKYQGAGARTVNFNAAALSSGIYFYHLKAGNYTEVKKMTLIK